jgi:hypothetical protein
MDNPEKLATYNTFIYICVDIFIFSAQPKWFLRVSNRVLSHFRVELYKGFCRTLVFVVSASNILLHAITLLVKLKTQKSLGLSTEYDDASLRMRTPLTSITHHLNILKLLVTITHKFGRELHWTQQLIISDDNTIEYDNATPRRMRTRLDTMSLLYPIEFSSYVLCYRIQWSSHPK